MKDSNPSTRAPRVITAIQSLRKLKLPVIQAYEKIAARLPARLAGTLDYQQARYLNSWGGPFNGQRYRREIFLALVREIEPRAIVETGTYRGTTTLFMHEATGLPVWTVEKNKRYYHYARLRLRSYSSVRLVQGDSRHFLRQLAASGCVDVATPTIFYLDAHWEQDIPLREEVAVVFAKWHEAAVIIDDFCIEDDIGYRYDDYGGGRRISYEYLKQSLPTDVECLVPAAPSEAETGARRGCGIFVSASLAPVVRGNSLVRPMPRESSRGTPKGKKRGLHQT